MPARLIEATEENSLPLILVTVGGWKDWLAAAPARHQAWLAQTGFKPAAGSFSLLPGEEGSADAVVLVLSADGRGEKGELPALWDFATLPGGLPKGVYHLDSAHHDNAPVGVEMADRLALGWSLGAYSFTHYKRKDAARLRDPEQSARLVWPEAARRARVEAFTAGITLARNLINMPAADMGPAELEESAKRLTEGHGATVAVTLGEDLLKAGYPMVHAVGKGSPRAPRLIDIRWGNPDAPKVTLVGKGVCFDSGGLDIKPAGGMKLMKKDMGGAAITLGLAKLIMMLELPVCLRVLVPAVENSVSGEAFRPLDVLDSRKGLTVEVGNTDAEGRLILADALYEAATESPELLIDIATLTGAARVALGTELPALFCNDDRMADEILAAGREIGDPLWRLPLHQPYRRQLDSKTADLSNISEGGFGGAITAALFLEQFIDPRPVGGAEDESSEEAEKTEDSGAKALSWAHIDVMAWNQGSKPGRPEGGEAMALRALFRMLEKRFGNSNRS